MLSLRIIAPDTIMVAKTMARMPTMQPRIAPQGRVKAKVFGLVGILRGNGAYDGLTFTVVGACPPGSATLTYDGLIQPGSPPPGFPVLAFPEPSPSPASE